MNVINGQLDITLHSPDSVSLYYYNIKAIVVQASGQRYLIYYMHMYIRGKQNLIGTSKCRHHIAVK